MSESSGGEWNRAEINGASPPSDTNAHRLREAYHEPNGLVRTMLEYPE